MEKIFFNSSLPRAGSTLLQNILAQNPNFYATPTSGVLELLSSARKVFTNENSFKAQDQDLMDKAWAGFCRNGIEGFFNDITDKKYVIDKCRGWGIYYNFLNSFYPNPKIVCMVRDLRSIFASMEKNYRNNQHKDAGIVNWAEGTNTTIAKRSYFFSKNDPVGPAIERLHEIIEEKLDRNILFIRFEDLTSNPQTELNKIYDFFEIERYQHDFQNVEQITQENDVIHGMFGDHKIRKVVKPIIKPYKEILSSKLCHEVVKNYSWFYEYFNYQL